MYYKIFKKKKKSSCHNVMQIFVTAPRLLLSISSEGERLGRSQMETSSHPHSLGPQAKSLEFVPYCLKAKPREESAEEGRKRRCQSPGLIGCAPGGSGSTSLELTLGSAQLSGDGKTCGGAVFSGEVRVIVLQGFEQ